jgi:hypothetical protein
VITLLTWVAVAAGVVGAAVVVIFFVTYPWNEDRPGDV